MRILGVDPGVATIGFGLIEADRGSQRLLRYGVINTPAGLPLSNRLYQISRDMEELLGAFHPDEAAVEELFFSKNITTGIAVAHGRGGAEKRQVMLMTQRLLKMEEIPRPDDAADALAIAICHGRSATSLLNTERVFDPRKYDTR